jgi:hypothetical protein
VSSTADILRRGWRCEPVVYGGLYVRGCIGILRGGGEGLYGVPCGLELIARVRHDQYLVRRDVEGSSPLGGLADGGMDELARRIAAANAQSLMVWAFPGYMGA